MSGQKIGVVIITHAQSKRWDNIKALIQKFANFDIFVSVDGPSDKYNDQLEGEDIKEIFLHVKNLGSRLHCPHAITSISDRYEYLIILEDDLVFHELPNFEELLLILKDDIIGCCFYGADIKNKSYVKASAFSTWGWLVKSAVWKDFSSWNSNYKERKVKIPLKNIICKYFLMKIFKNNRRKEVPHWDYPFMEYVISNQLYFLFSRTIVENIGFNDDAVNTKFKPKTYINYSRIIVDKKSNANRRADDFTNCTYQILYSLNGVPYNTRTFLRKIKHVFY